ncbi:MAG: hypothetical protein ACE5Q3_02085 [Alphaproteobacteria bacterium]
MVGRENPDQTHLVLGKRTVSDHDRSRRTCDLALEYASLLDGKPYEGLLELYNRHGLRWDHVPATVVMDRFDPDHINLYDTSESGNPRLGFFGKGNPVDVREAPLSGTPIRAIFKNLSPSIADSVASDIEGVAALGRPVLQHVHIEDRGHDYHRLMLPSSSSGEHPDRVLAFILPRTYLLLDTSLMQQPPGGLYT